MLLEAQLQIEPLALEQPPKIAVIKLLLWLLLLQDAQQMFDSSMTTAAIMARLQELQQAAGIKAQLVSHPPWPGCTPLMLTLRFGSCKQSGHNQRPGLDGLVQDPRA
jgi:hypothetical protein